jgi:hypothetical protein
MTNHTEPLYVGIDVEPLLDQLGQDDRDRIEHASQRAVDNQTDTFGDQLRRSARRSTSQPRLLAEDFAARFALAGDGGVAIRGSLVA